MVSPLRTEAIFHRDESRGLSSAPSLLFSFVVSVLYLYYGPSHDPISSWLCSVRPGVFNFYTLFCSTLSSPLDLTWLPVIYFLLKIQCSWSSLIWGFFLLLLWNSCSNFNTMQYNLNNNWMFRILKAQESKHSVLLFAFFDDQDIKIKVMYKIKKTK